MRFVVIRLAGDRLAKGLDRLLVAAGLIGDQAQQKPSRRRTLVLIEHLPASRSARGKWPAL